MTTAITKGRPAAGNDDAAIGRRVLEARLRRGITQGQLGEALGVSFQQIQKYEKGANRVATTRLVQIAAALGVTTNDLIGSGDEPTPGFAYSTEALRVAAAFDRLAPSEREAVLFIVGRIAAPAPLPAAA